MTRKKSTNPAKKTATPAKKNTTQKAKASALPDQFMADLVHPLKDVAIAVREILRHSHPDVQERIKWAAPSYYTSTDLVTFNLRTEKHIHLVFHHAAIASIKSPLLHGEYTDRRMMYFKDLEEVKQHKPELLRIMKEYVKSAK